MEALDLIRNDLYTNIVKFSKFYNKKVNLIRGFLNGSRIK